MSEEGSKKGRGMHWELRRIWANEKFERSENRMQAFYIHLLVLFCPKTTAWRCLILRGIVDVVTT